MIVQGNNVYVRNLQKDNIRIYLIVKKKPVYMFQKK
jgi:hypothetical protein